jgi:hypothetical protein
MAGIFGHDGDELLAPPTLCDIMHNKFSSLASITMSSLLAIMLSACGGGGDNNVAADQSPSGVTNPVRPLTPPPVCSGPLPTSTASVTVQGTASFDRVAQRASGGLDYSSITLEPIRGATVELLSGNCIVVATTQTNATGQYVFTNVPGSVTLSVRVRAELKQTSGAAQWDVSVNDNTNNNAMYTLLSPSFNTGTSATQNLRAGSGWTGNSYGQARAAGPFAILDTFYQSQQKVLSVNPSAVFPQLRAFWSINNSSANGDFAVGNIGSSFFREAFSNNQLVRELYVLGRENSDTDEYDGSVVAHEWGHYFQSAFSRDDSMGGQHGSGDDRLDRRIAFSEGWGNAWSGMVLQKNSYLDSKGVGQASGFSVALNSGYASNGSNGSKGWFREFSVQYILWDLNRQAGFAPIYSALTNSSFKTGVPLSDIHSFASAYRSVASNTATAAFNTLLAAESISNNSDALGNNETNAGGASLTLPYYRSLAANGAPSSGQTLCVTSQFDTANNFNKLGRYVYATFSTAAAGARNITVSANAANADTDFEVFSGGQIVARAEQGTTNAEAASINLAAGQHVLVIYDFNNTAGSPCFTVSIQ